MKGKAKRVLKRTISTLLSASLLMTSTYLPVKAEKTPRLESDLRNALFEARRILTDEGRLVVIGSLAHAESTLRKTQGIRMLARYDLTLSGQKSAIWLMTLKPVDLEEA